LSHTVKLFFLIIVIGTSFLVPIANVVRAFQVIIIATNLESPQDVAVDSNYVYFIENPANYWQGTVKKVGINGGSVITLAEGIDPSHIAIDSEYVYFTGGAFKGAGYIGKVSKSGGKVEMLATNLEVPTYIAVDSDFIYFSDKAAGKVFKVSKAGGTVTTLASGLDRPQGIAVDSSYVYFVDYSSLRKVSKAGGTVTTLASGLGLIDVIVDSDFVYFTASGGKVFKVSKAGGTVTTLAISGEGAWIMGGIALDSEYVYYVVTGGKSIFRVPKIGGKTETLATDQCYPLGIAVDSSYVYFAEDEKGNIKKISISENLEPDGEIIDYSILTPEIHQEEELQVQVNVENTGNIRATYNVYIGNIYDSSGNSIGTAYSESHQIIELDPGVSRTLILTWTTLSTMKPGDYTGDLHLQIAKPGESWEKNKKYPNAFSFRVIGVMPGYIQMQVINNDDDLQDISVYIDGDWKLGKAGIPPGGEYTHTFEVKGSDYHDIELRWHDDDTALDYSKNQRVYVGSGETVYVEFNIDMHIGNRQLPDLRVDKIDISPWRSSREYEVGESIVIKPTIKNEGNSDAEDFAVEWYVDGNLINRWPGWSLKAGDSISSLGCKWTVTEGPHIIEVVVDPENKVEELDESDNRLSTEIIGIVYEKPDILVLDILISPNLPKPGDSVTVNCLVKNEGHKETGQFGIALYIDDTIRETSEKFSLAAEETKEYSFSYIWVAEAGTHKLTVVADYLDEVDESYETNNVLDKRITVAEFTKVSTSITIDVQPNVITEGSSDIVTISGRLTRTDNGNGIADKTIFITWPGGVESTNTDSSGSYSYCLKVNLEQGSYQIQASFLGDYEFASSMSQTTLTVIPKESIVISNVIVPLSVKINQEFTVIVAVAYNFILDTEVKVGIWDIYASKWITYYEDTLSGINSRLFTFTVRSPEKAGTYRWMVRAEFMKDQTWQHHSAGIFDICVAVVKGELDYSVFKLTPLYFDVEFEGKHYKAFLIENVSAPLWPGDLGGASIYKWTYSRYNWLVLNQEGRLVNEIEDYVKIAFAAEMAYTAVTIWSPQNLRNEANYFDELSKYAITLETLSLVGSTASSMISGIALGQIAVPTAASATVKFVASGLINGVKEGLMKPDDIVKKLAISSMLLGSGFLNSAADLIESIFEQAKARFPDLPRGIKIKYEDMVDFYLNVRNGRIMGFSGMKILDNIYNQGIKVYLSEVINGLISGAVPWQVMSVANMLVSIPELNDLLEEMMEMEEFYNFINATFFKCSMKFASVLLNEQTKISILNTKTEVGNEINVFISTNSNVLSKFLSTSNGYIKINVEGPTGTEGVVKIRVPKELLPKRATIDELLVTIDGEEVQFDVTETEESFILRIQYAHSKHEIIVYYVTYTLTVEVVSIINQPLANAKVLLQGPSNLLMIRYTNEYGYAIFNKIPKGEIIITINYHDFQQKRIFLIDSSQQTRIIADIIDIFGLHLATKKFMMMLAIVATSAAIIVILLFKRKAIKHIDKV